MLQKMVEENMFVKEDNTSIMPSFRMGGHSELHVTNGASQQMQKYFCSPIWDHSLDQSNPFVSALSSMVSSLPPSNNAAAAAPPPGGCTNGNIVLRELTSKLGSIYDSGEVSSQSYMNGNNSTNTSCYSTPMNSPPKLNSAMMDHQIRRNLQNIQFPGNHFPAQSSLTQLTTDPGFADRASRYSSFANKNLGGTSGNQLFGLNECDLHQRIANQMDCSWNLSRVSSNQSLVKVSGSQMNNGQNTKDSDQKFSKLSRSSTPKPEFYHSPENSSVCEQDSGGEIDLNCQNDIYSRKRKPSSKKKGKDAASAKEANDGENNEFSPKRCKSDEIEKSKGEENGTKNSAGRGNKKEGRDDQKPTEPKRDYIHVRARRGEATDAHSLAERVRREKISQRMKLLQDLVPGCNKVSGKAVMLDEIINYVQSLQQQVEFLSMKLTTIYPRMDVNLESLPKEMFQSGESMPNGTFALNNLATTYPFQFQSQQVPNLQSQISKENASQAALFFEGDLQSMIFGQNQAHNCQGAMPTGQMKVEL